jgi:hypothetical protein
MDVQHRYTYSISVKGRIRRAIAAVAATAQGAAGSTATLAGTTNGGNGLKILNILLKFDVDEIEKKTHFFG